MKKYLYLRIIALLLIITTVMICFSGCGKEENIRVVKKYSLPDNKPTVETGQICSNSKYSLSWDNGIFAMQIFAVSNLLLDRVCMREIPWLP